MTAVATKFPKSIFTLSVLVTAYGYAILMDGLFSKFRDQFSLSRNFFFFFSESEGLEEFQRNSFLSDVLQLSPGSVLVCECLGGVHMPVAASLYS